MEPSTAAAALGSVRVAFGAAPFLAPRLAQRVMRFPAEHDNASARLMTGLFAVREIALGAQMIAARHDPDRVKRLAGFNAAVDAGDALNNLVFLVRRRGIDAAAAGTFVAALAGVGAWSWLRRASTA